MQRRSLASGRKVQFERTDSGATLHVAISSTTNVDVILKRPTTFRLPKGPEVLTEVRFYADDPRALVGSSRAGTRGEAPSGFEPLYEALQASA